MTENYQALPRCGQGQIATIALIALVCMAPSMTINTMHQITHTPGPLALPLAVASVLSVALAAASPFAIERAIAARNVALFLVALLTGSVCLSYNLTVAIGAASTTRAEITGARTAETAKAALLAGQLEQAEKSRTALAVVSREKTPGVIEAELRGLEQRRAWTSSKQCTDATLPASRRFCADHAAKQAALDAARKVEDLDGEISNLKAKLLVLSDKATGQPADVQAANIAAALAFVGSTAKAPTIAIALNLSLAVLVETIGAFGPLVFAAVLRHQCQHEINGSTLKRKAKARRPDEGKIGTAAADVVQLHPGGLAAMRKRGMTLQQIGDAIGMSASTVSRRLAARKSMRRKASPAA